MNLRATKHLTKTYWAGVHLHLTGETIVPSFLSSANTLSTTFLSRPERVATSPAATGLPASRIVFSTNSFSILINIKSLTTKSVLSFLQFRLPEAVEIAVFIYRHRFLVSEGYHCLRLVVQINSDATVLCLDVDE